VLLVNGAPLVEELDAAMAKLGFAGHDLAISASDEEWPDERPADWPPETLPDVAVNEQWVRVSGSFHGRTIRVLPDMPIAGGGTYTIWQAWDTGPERAPDSEMTGAAPQVTQAPDSKSHTGLFVGLVLGAIGVGAWQYITHTKRAEKDRARLDVLEARAERARLGGHIRELMTGGYPEGDAAAIAASEAMMREEQTATAQQPLNAPAGGP
jgi:hypothetical protein